MSTAAERFRRADELFNAALRLDPELRDSYIHEQCAGDPLLLSQLCAMLGADRIAHGVLDEPALGRSASMSSMEAALFAASAIPERIGHYRIIRVIGRGGMGVVYEAEQDQPSRRVALKVIRPAGITSASMLRRFRHEAQMLGRCKHPGIAQIYEAGTDGQGEGSQPYFAMELVNGRPLLEYAQSHSLDTKHRLELLALICDAVHHAHLNGVIHRDLKPVNILVTEESSDPDAPKDRIIAQPKVLDFGIARSLDADAHTATLHTTAGALLGTVAYMSPEQAAGDPAKIDPRSDVYALGIIGYELLSGRLPYNVHGKLVHEAVRVIRENEPSRLSSVTRAYRGDIDTIISKALEKEPDRRYQSAADFAADIRRFLREQPIAARPASQLYQLRKFARRNRALVTGVATAFIALLIGAGIAVQQAVSATAAAAEARRQAYRASLAAASSAVRYHEVEDAGHQLDMAPRELRGWEWSHLQSRLDDSLRALHMSFVPMCMAISPDGRMVASCDSGGGIHTWSVPGFAALGTFQLTGNVQSRRIAGLSFSPDGRTLRADAWQGSAWIDLETMTLLARDELAIAPRSNDGRFGVALTKGSQSSVRLIETATEREVLHIRLPADALPRIAFSPDGEQALLCVPDGTGVSMYQTGSGELVWRRPDLPHALDAAFSSDGMLVGIAGGSGAAYIVDADSGHDRIVLDGHAGAITAIGFSHDAAVIATASNDRTVGLWRTADGARLSLMHGCGTQVLDLVFPSAPPGERPSFVTLGADWRIRWWDAKAASDPFVLPASGTVYGVAFSPDGARIAAASLGGDRPLRIWDAASHRELLATSDGHLSTIAFNHDGTRLGVGRSTTAPTSIVDAQGNAIASIPGHWWRTNWVHFAGDSELWSLGNGGQFIAQDIRAGETLRARQFAQQDAGEGCRAAVAPDRSLIAVASGGTIHLLDHATWEEVATLSIPRGAIYALAFSPDSKLLVSGGSDRTLRIWDVARRRIIASMNGHTEEIYAAIFSPDGRRLVSGGRDRVIRVWSTDTFEPLTALYGHTSLVYCLAFSPDGQVLASGGGDAAVRLWDTRPYRSLLMSDVDTSAETTPPLPPTAPGGEDEDEDEKGL